MAIDPFENQEAMATQAVEVIAEAASKAIAERGRFTLAISGGSTPKRMLSLLSCCHRIDWSRVHLFQVDERIAPAGHVDRNETMQKSALFTDKFQERHTLAGRWWMPVDRLDANDCAAVQQACRDYEATIQEQAGPSGILDLVQLGLGDDGHTASLVPGDAVCDATTDIAATALYKGRRRLTFTYPLIERARQLLWTVAGANKQDALSRWMAKDPSIPGGRVSQENALMLVDQDARGA